jgi:Subtilase family
VEAELRNLRETVRTKTGRLWPDEIVVDLPHLREVLGVLTRELGAAPTGTPLDSPELGLALIQIADVSKAAAGLRARRPPSDGSGPIPDLVRKATAAYEDISDLDLVMNVLRGWFEWAYQGWAPDIGKSRLIRGVEGLPEVGGGGEGDPEPLVPCTLELPPPTVGSGSRIRVGILDTPIYAHPSLAGRYIVAGADSLLTDDELQSGATSFLAAHATYLVGAIAQHAPDAEVHVRGVLDPATGTASAWEVASTMVEFRGSDVDILNMSFGCATDDGRPPLLLSRAADLLHPETVLIAAAGNHGAVTERGPDEDEFPSLTPKTASWPGALSYVCAVGATDGQRLADFSPRLPWVDLTAPGVGIASTYLPGLVDIPVRDEHRNIIGYTPRDFGEGCAKWGGTSVAAAIVTGQVAALAQRESFSAREALEFLLQRSANGPGGDSRPFHTDA